MTLQSVRKVDQWRCQYKLLMFIFLSIFAD